VPAYAGAVRAQALYKARDAIAFVEPHITDECVAVMYRSNIRSLAARVIHRCTSALRALSASFLSNACYVRLTICTAHKRPVPNIIMASNPQLQGSHRGAEAFQALTERRLVKHEPVAKALRAAALSVVFEIISLAYIQVAKWEEGSLCSEDYIVGWRELLKNPAASVLEERSSCAAALGQNSQNAA